MTLSEWCEKEGRGALTRLTKATGLTFAAVSRVVKGTAQARADTAKKLSDATGGAVSAASILGIDEPVAVDEPGAEA